jgi:hypothetical protein
MGRGASPKFLDSRSWFDLPHHDPEQRRMGQARGNDGLWQSDRHDAVSYGEFV